MHHIWYTSNTNTIITPNSTDRFGANIVSNTYKDGKGIIAFDGTITAIGGNAFQNITELTSINLPDSVTIIESYAFTHCSNLTEPAITKSIRSIEAYAFQFCTSFTNVHIPENVTKIDVGAFEGCCNLKDFNGKYASSDGRCLVKDSVIISFAPYGLTTYTLPSSIKKIGYSAFASCSNIDTIIIPNSVTTIGTYAFYGCSNLTTITLPKSITSLSDGIFWNCI